MPRSRPRADGRAVAGRTARPERTRRPGARSAATRPAPAAPARNTSTATGRLCKAVLHFCRSRLFTGEGARRVYEGASPSGVGQAGAIGARRSARPRAMWLTPLRRMMSRTCWATPDWRRAPRKSPAPNAMPVRHPGSAQAHIRKGRSSRPIELPPSASRQPAAGIRERTFRRCRQGRCPEQHCRCGGRGSCSGSSSSDNCWPGTAFLASDRRDCLASRILRRRFPPAGRSSFEKPSNWLFERCAHHFSRIGTGRRGSPTHAFLMCFG